MRGRRTSLRVVLTPEERNELERRLRCTTTPSGLARRSRVILGVADGLRSGGSRPVGRHDGEACAQVDHAVPEKSPRRVTRSPRTRPQAGLFPPRWRCTW